MDQNNNAMKETMKDDRAETNGRKEDLTAKLQTFTRRRSFYYVRTLLFSAALFFVVYYLAFAIKTDGFELTGVSRLGFQQSLIFIKTVGWVLAIKLFVMIARKTYRHIGYYATLRDLRSIMVDSVLSFALIFIFFAVVNKARLGTYSPIFEFDVTLTTLLLDLILTIMARGGVRMTSRFFKESVLPRLDPEFDEEPAFLVGANSSGAHVANIINTQHSIGYQVVGFLTIHDYKVKMNVGVLPVVAHVDDLVDACNRLDVKTVLFIAGSLPGSVFRQIYQMCDANALKLQVVPPVEFLPDKKIPIREIDVSDLLKRDPIMLDKGKIQSLVTGRRVMVTGAGGSIGSEICRQLVQFKPKQLFLLGRGENRIFFLERELHALDAETIITPIIADVANASRIDGVFAEARPEIVFHAAAHKHVPLMEANIPEAIHNNIYGTKVVADASDRYGVDKFVMVSTDKAVNPSSIMGCSKHMAERYVNSLAARSKTRFIVTRFGNVLGSNGSVVPIFTKQIQNGGPITITDFRMTRYFMTIPEASQLVLEAAAMGKGGEIFVLDMGEPVKIVDLAKDMIRLAGLPEKAIEIKEIGLRPGEKLYEELYFESEKRIETNQPKLFAAEHRPFEYDQVQAQIDELIAVIGEEPETIRKRFQEFIPEYKPSLPGGKG